MSQGELTIGSDNGRRHTAGSVSSLLRFGHTDAAVRRLVATGYEPLDGMLDGGIHTGDLVLLGGLPGIGKTIAALQWARHAAMQGMPTVYACYEHDATTLLTRLLLLEIGELAQASGEPSDPQMRSIAIGAMASPGGLDSAMMGNLVLRAARARMEAYGDNLWLVPAAPTEVDVPALEELVTRKAGGPALLVVDHLQKVGPRGDAESTVADVAVQLKGLSIRAGIAVVGVIGTASSALGSRRVRIHHLEEAAGVGYEADLIVLMNDKLAAVSRRHTAFDTLRADEYRAHVVFSIEKNRSGPSGISFDFRKDFAHYRFDPHGSVLEEQLVDGVIVAD